MRKRVVAAVLAVVVAVAVVIPSSLHFAAREYDQYQHLPVYLHRGHAHLMSLLSGQFDCGRGWRRAVLMSLNGGVWIGCWRMDGTKVHVLFEDGQAVDIDLPAKHPSSTWERGI